VICQHFYTRERRGLYKNTAGYDTVGKSSALADTFIKEQVHPYCVFSGGNGGTGSAAGVTTGGIAETPRALTLVHFPCGRMLFGQAVFVPADFTGQRAAFFMHNYIFEAGAAAEAIGALGKLLRTRFESSWTLEAGTVEDVNVLPCDEGIFSSRQSVGNAVIAKIVHCAIEAVEKSKKVYVLLPQNASHDFACGLLVEIYAALPEPFRQVMGFCTYTREVERRKNIHLAFLERDAYIANRQRFHGSVVVDLEEDDLPLAVSAVVSPSVVSPSAGVQGLTYEELIAKKIAALSVRQLFAEGDFWRVRAPALAGIITRLEAARVCVLLDTLTMQDFFATPDSALRKRKDSATEDAAVFVVFSMIKQACANILAKKPFSLRYLLGSYMLSKEDYARAVGILRKFYVACGGDIADENVVFLDNLKNLV